MRFYVKKIEAMRHRNSGKKSCNQMWKKNDEKIMLEIVKQTGCKPPHWKLFSTLPVCKDAAKMKIFHKANNNNHEKPCQTIQTLSFGYEEHKILDFENRELENQTTRISKVVFHFTDQTFMKIQQVRRYGVKDAVGDIGGYLGLFLGFSILQLQEMFARLIQFIVKLFYRKCEITINDAN